MKKVPLFVAVIFVILALVAVSNVWKRVDPPTLTFAQQCLADGNMWHEMPPLKNGIMQPGDAQPGCMTADGMHHFADEAAYRAAKDPGASDVTFTHDALVAGTTTNLTFAIRTEDGSVPDLFLSHEKYIHVIIASKDTTVFAHIHPDDRRSLTETEIQSGNFTVPYVFPKGGDYIVAVDYANQLRSESRQFRIAVAGVAQEEMRTYASPQNTNGIEVSLTATPAFAGDVATLRFTFRRDGREVTNLEPYLGAAMHIAAIKSDLTEFIHTHGEVHSGGVTQTTTHIHAPPPAAFGPTVESHIVFPSSGTYTIFAQFKRAGIVSSVPFTLRVE